MIRSGENVVNGVPVDVERRRVRRVSIRVKPDGRVLLSVPKWGATLRDAEAFLLSKWKWVLKTRGLGAARTSSSRPARARPGFPT